MVDVSHDNDRKEGDWNYYYACEVATSPSQQKVILIPWIFCLLYAMWGLTLPPTSTLELVNKYTCALVGVHRSSVRSISCYMPVSLSVCKNTCMYVHRYFNSFLSSCTMLQCTRWCKMVTYNVVSRLVGSSALHGVVRRPFTWFGKKTARYAARLSW